MASSGPYGAPTSAIYTAAVAIAKLLLTGDCVTRVEMEELGYSSSTILAAIGYLSERGGVIHYHPKERCWNVILSDVDWRDLTLDDLDDLGLLPDGLRSDIQDRVDARYGRERERRLCRRLSNP